MYLLRRAAVRAVAQQPSRTFSSLRQGSNRVAISQIAKPSVSRSFHQTRIWLADDQLSSDAEKNKASVAESESSQETVSAEPSAEEQRKEIVEESIATPDVADAAESTSSAEHKAQSATDQAQDIANGAIETAQSAASSVAQAARSTFDQATAPYSQRTSSGNESKVNHESRIIYVGNLFFEVTAPQLESKFSSYGQITNSRIVTDSRGMSKGFGYIEFAEQADADRAVKELDQTVLEGRRMAVQYHVRKPSRQMGFNSPGRPSNEPSKTLFIGNMSYQMSDRDLNDLFREVRDVIDVRVAIDRRSGQPRGFAHADFVDVASAQRAMEHLSKKVIYGRQLRIDFSASSNTTKIE